MSLTSAIESAREIYAWLDEHGRVVCREDKQGGGVVGNNRAIPNNWTPLAALPDKPMSEDEIASKISHMISRDNHYQPVDIIRALKAANVLYVEEKR